MPLPTPIRHVLIGLLLAVLAIAANAQSPQPDDCIWRSHWTPFGTGSEQVYGVSEADGVRVAWWGHWCPRADGTWRQVGQRCVIGRACMDVASLTSLLDTAARSADPLQALRDARARLDVAPLPSEQAAWDLALRDVTAAAARVRPEQAVYRSTHEVAPLSGYTDRPARQVVDGKLVEIKNPPRVSTGVDCAMGVEPQFPSGSYVWAAVVGQAHDMRWYCRRR